jgi:hypothetical protein
VVTHFLRFVIQFIYKNATGFLYPAAFSLSIFVIIALKVSGKARLFMGQTSTQRMQLMHRSLSVWLGSSIGMAPVGQSSAQVPHLVQVSLAAGWKAEGFSSL